MPRQSDRYLPLTNATLQVLLALATGESHGYGILRRIRHNTDGRVRIVASTLYPIISRLERDGLIEESDWRPDPAIDDERRRYYRLTTLGRRVCKAEVRRLETVVADARRVLPQR